MTYWQAFPEAVFVRKPTLSRNAHRRNSRSQVFSSLVRSPDHNRAGNEGEDKHRVANQ
jgi:hypothetical protein